MKSINRLSFILLVVATSLRATDRSKEEISFFNDYNTDIVLIIDTNRKYKLLGYGGSANGSADCVIKSYGSISHDSLSGYLTDVKTDIVSYEISKERLKFSGVLMSSSFSITEANTNGNCGYGANFMRTYEKVEQENEIKKKVEGFLELLGGFEENENIIAALKQCDLKPAHQKTKVDCTEAVYRKKGPLKNETLVYAFMTENGKKVTVSASWGEEPEYIVYRFINESVVELQYPATLDSSSFEQFTYYGYIRGTGVAGGTGADTINRLSFNNKGYRYTLFEEYYPDEGKKKLGIRIENTATGKKFTIKGKSGTVEGDLSELRYEERINQEW